MWLCNTLYRCDSCYFWKNLHCWWENIHILSHGEAWQVLFDAWVSEDREPGGSWTCVLTCFRQVKLSLWQFWWHIAYYSNIIAIVCFQNLDSVLIYFFWIDWHVLFFPLFWMMIIPYNSTTIHYHLFGEEYNEFMYRTDISWSVSSWPSQSCHLFYAGEVRQAYPKWPSVTLVKCQHLDIWIEMNRTLTDTACSCTCMHSFLSK